MWHEAACIGGQGCAAIEIAVFCAPAKYRQLVHAQHTQLLVDARREIRQHTRASTHALKYTPPTTSVTRRHARRVDKSDHSGRVVWQSHAERDVSTPRVGQKFIKSHCFCRSSNSDYGVLNSRGTDLCLVLISARANW